MLLHASGAEKESVLAYGVLSQLISSVSAAALDAPTVLPDTGPVGAETCATWPDAPLAASCSAPRLPGRGMIFGLWA